MAVEKRHIASCHLGGDCEVYLQWDTANNRVLDFIVETKEGTDRVIRLLAENLNVPLGIQRILEERIVLTRQQKQKVIPIPSQGDTYWKLLLDEEDRVMMLPSKVQIAIHFSPPRSKNGN